METRQCWHSPVSHVTEFCLDFFGSIDVLRARLPTRCLSCSLLAREGSINTEFSRDLLGADPDLMIEEFLLLRLAGFLDPFAAT